MSKSQALQQAINFVEQNTKRKSSQFAMSYHFAPPVGWCNDPNGLSFYDGKLHLFYQYYPFDAKWGKMHWGHAVSSNFVSWQNQMVALAPDKSYDSEWGCFSGSALIKGKTMYLMYTGVGGNSYQTQCIAVSENGIDFEKIAQNPVIGEHNKPSLIDIKDFRDPYVFTANGNTYCLVGCKCEKGNIALYRCSDEKLTQWEFVGYLFDNADGRMLSSTDGVLECPSIAEIDGYTVLMCSPQNVCTQGTQFENLHSSVYAVGQLSYESGEFQYSDVNEIDGGFDFYAPQLLKLPDGRTIMIAWMQMWNRNYPTAVDGWAGNMTMPRQLSVVNGKLIQQPIKELLDFRQNKIEVSDFELKDNSIKSFDNLKGRVFELSFDINTMGDTVCGVKILKCADKYLQIYYDNKCGVVTVNRSNTDFVITGSESNNDTRSVTIEKSDKLTFDIFVDNTAVEIFIKGGLYTMAVNYYSPVSQLEVEFFCDKGCAQYKNIVKYDIVV